MGGLNMAKAVLISIRPEWVEKILAGEKTLEVRKNRRLSAISIAQRLKKILIDCGC